MPNTTTKGHISVTKDEDGADQLTCSCGSSTFTSIEPCHPDLEETVSCDGCGQIASYTPGADAIYDLTNFEEPTEGLSSDPRYLACDGDEVSVLDSGVDVHNALMSARNWGEPAFGHLYRLDISDAGVALEPLHLVYGPVEDGREQQVWIVPKTPGAYYATFRLPAPLPKCERCAHRYDPEASHADPDAGLCGDCSRRNADRVCL